MEEPEITKQPQEGETEPQTGEVFDADYVRRLRAEAADYRRKLRDLEAKVKAEQEAKMTEQEGLRQRLAELEQREAEYQRLLRTRTLEYEVKIQAVQMGVVDPEIVYRLIEPGEIEYDDDGRPKNLEKVLKSLVSARPYLLSTSAASPTNPSRGGLTLDDVRRMSPAEINRRWDEVKRVLGG